MKRHRQYTPDIHDLERPTQHEVDCFLEPALIKHAETAKTYAHYHFTDGQALAFLRAVQTFPANTTVEQIQQAILRRSQVVRMPESSADRRVS